MYFDAQTKSDFADASQHVEELENDVMAVLGGRVGRRNPAGKLRQFTMSVLTLSDSYGGASVKRGRTTLGLRVTDLARGTGEMNTQPRRE